MNELTVPVKVQDARFVASGKTLAELPPPALAEVAFAGRSNVGKSSLVNSLLGRRRLVRVSGTPGCTRGLNLFRIRLSGAEFDLVDLPGYGYARRSKAERASWGPMVESYLTERPSLRAVVLIVDVRRGLMPDDVQLLEFLAHLERQVIGVATKSDKLPMSRRKPLLETMRRESGVRWLSFSAKTGAGRDELWLRVLQGAGIDPASLR